MAGDVKGGEPLAHRLQFERTALALKTTELETSRVRLAIARVGLAAALVGLLGLLLRLQAFGGASRLGDMHVSPKQAEAVELRPPRTSRVRGRRGVPNDLGSERD
jgi:hypothetical protein